MTIGPDGKPQVREFGNVKSATASATKIGQYVGVNHKYLLKENRSLIPIQ